MPQPGLLPINIQRIQQTSNPAIHPNTLKLKNPNPKRPIHKSIPNLTPIKTSNPIPLISNITNKKFPMILNTKNYT